MRHGTWVRVFALSCLIFGSICAYAPPLPAQVRIPQEALVDVAAVEEVLRIGEQLERERRWGEALAHYEQALHEHPGQADLTERVKLARYHYEVARRYNDPSFLAVVDQLREQDALDLYAEVLLKIQSHYVDPPDWQAIAEGGAVAFQAALSEAPFVKRYHVPCSSEQLRIHGQQVVRLAKAQSIRTRYDAQSLVDRIARLTQQETAIPATAVSLEFACSAAASLDEYSAFLTGDQLDEVLSQIEGNFVGLGIELKTEENALLIVNVIPGGPADQARLRPGDRIVTVAGQSMLDISSDAGADLLKGPDGSSVQLTVVTSDGTERSMVLQRRRVDVPSVERTSILDARYGVAYIELSNFQKTTSRDIDAALWKLHRQGMRSLILDVRGNPGGLLTAAVDVADKFISSGPIVATRGRIAGEDFDYTARLAGTWRVPLVVLIDGDSASASEIFAGAIRDHRRGTIVGTRSYGKGSVQGIFPLSATKAGLRLTTAKFYSPSGRPISYHGVDPDVFVHVTAKAADDDAVPVSTSDQEDPFLSAAIEVARQKAVNP